MDLVIVESPTKSKTLSEFLGKDYQVAATMGHIKDLPKSKLGVDVEHDFKPDYLPVVGKEKVVKQFKQLAKKAERIILATDSDREGEVIAWHAAQILRQEQKTKNQKQKEILRITFHEITKSAIKKALAHPGKINMPLVHAQQARRVLDRLVGYKLSPLLWRKIRRGLSAGRVQTVTVRLVVDREKEIDKFVAEEYWEIEVELKRHLGGKKMGAPTFLAKLVKKNNQPAKITNQLAAKEINLELKKANFEVGAVEKKETLQFSPPPFKTSTLQQKAAQNLHFSSKRTMRAAQALYEKGLITYHRTDSVVLAWEAINKLRAFIKDSYGPDYLPAKAKIFKTKSKLAQEAHEAIRPTNVEYQSSNIKLGHDEQKLYDLIWKRAVASQTAQAVWDQTKIKTLASGQKNLYEFLTEGKIIKFDGWLKVYGGAKTGKSNDYLPAVKKGDDLDLIKLRPKQKFTQPPSRYTEATLIKTLEEKGIGRPSTYAPTISTIQNRQYVEKIEAKFQPTSLGTTVNDFLLEYFPEIFDYDFTAKMETDLDEIADGKKKWVPVIKEFWQPFIKKLEGVTEVAKRVQVPTEVTGEKCPKCKKGNLVIRVGRFGKFISCSRFPKCRYTAPFAPKVEGVKCQKCGADVVIRKTKKGKQFYGCSRWPKCDWASWRKPKK